MQRYGTDDMEPEVAVQFNCQTVQLSDNVLISAATAAIYWHVVDAAVSVRIMAIVFLDTMHGPSWT